MKISRRSFLKLSVGAVALGARGYAGHAQARPILIGHQLDQTGAVAAFAKWHNQAIAAAIKRLNEQKGIARSEERRVGKECRL